MDKDINQGTSWVKRQRKMRRKKQVRHMIDRLFTISGILVISIVFTEVKRFEKNWDQAIFVVTPGEQNRESLEKSIIDNGVFDSASEDEWKLLLVNAWNPIPDEYQMTLTELKNGHAIDERCYPQLQKMMDDCRRDGLNPLICSSYRSQETQKRLFNNEVNGFMNQGYSLEKAKIEAGKVVAVPGTSEHQLGLAVDIVDIANQNLDESQEQTEVQKWLMKNSWKYGFILRYPDGKSDITGIIYEPWHYRYVGEAAAEEIYQQGICLEEYLDLISTERMLEEIQKEVKLGER